MRDVVSGAWALDLNCFLQFLFTAFLFLLGLLHLLKNTASKFSAEVGGEDLDCQADCAAAADSAAPMPGLPSSSYNRSNSNSNSNHDGRCSLCGNPGSRRCSACRMVQYCSPACQKTHWDSGHSKKCREFQKASSSEQHQQHGRKRAFGIALVPASSHTCMARKPPRDILFPYHEFVELFRSDRPDFPPCGLLNCGNSCFANVVLQCLSSTRPLVAYLLVKGHRRDCNRNDWCFLCEFQAHVERASTTPPPFSPINILSRLPRISGNFGYGKQEDAHEFMRFAIDAMQSACLDEFGGEKALRPAAQETSLIQHMFGGQLQSQVICLHCNNISNQYENMMDLTVEIQGDVSSLEECLDKFTVREWLHGENMYKCDRCNDYVKASKCLTIRRAPNILTIALKRFQSGMFGKLNKRVSFDEMLDLTPYMSEPGDGTDIYKLYAVVVHVDMLNASFFGHYVCYINDFLGNWYKVDDDKVRSVDLEEVLSQGAYMLLYSRICARPSCVNVAKSIKKEQQQIVNIVPKEAGAGRCVEGCTSAENRVISSNLASSSSQHLGPENAINVNSASVASQEIDTCVDDNSDPRAMISTEDHTQRLTSSVVASTDISSALGLARPSTDDKIISRSDVSPMSSDSPPTKYGSGNDKNSDDVSVKMDSLRLKAMPQSPAEKQGDLKSGEVSLTPAVRFEDSGGEMSGGNLSSKTNKPLLKPGFLVKRPWIGSKKRDVRAAARGEGFCVSSMLSNTDSFAKLSNHHQLNIEDNGLPERAACDTLSPTSVVGRSGKDMHKDEIFDQIKPKPLSSGCLAKRGRNTYINLDVDAATERIKCFSSCKLDSCNRCVNVSSHRESSSERKFEAVACSDGSAQPSPTSTVKEPQEFASKNEKGGVAGVNSKPLFSPGFIKMGQDAPADPASCVSYPNLNCNGVAKLLPHHESICKRLGQEEDG